MRYEGSLFRPPSEADALILQATIGCSWNRCTYCDMYSEKKFRLRPLEESLADLRSVHPSVAARVSKVFVADGDALVMPLEYWTPILEIVQQYLPKVRRVSCYAMARNILDKGEDALRQLRELGLSRLYIGPESGDDITLKRIAKGDDADAHVRAAELCHKAGIEMSVIALLGIGMDRQEEHARATGELVTKMDPQFFSALTVTVVPGTPLAKLASTGRFVVPEPLSLLKELRGMVESANPTACVFRTNHASNYLPLAGDLPKDRDRIVSVIDRAVNGEIGLRPEWMRGL